jgi:hypothetical protein
MIASGSQKLVSKVMDEKMVVFCSDACFWQYVKKGKSSVCSSQTRGAGFITELFITASFFLFVYWVISAGMKGITPGNTESSFKHCLGKRKNGQAFQGVLGTGWMKATACVGAEKSFL